MREREREGVRWDNLVTNVIKWLCEEKIVKEEEEEERLLALIQFYYKVINNYQINNDRIIIIIKNMKRYIYFSALN